MGDEVNNQTLTDRLEKILGGLKDGKQAAQATQPPAGGEQPVNKDTAPDPFAAQAQKFGGNSLADCFLKLARTDKQFHFLAVDRVLEDPRTFLRKRHGMDAAPHMRDQYVVSQADLDAMIGTMLQKGQGKEGMPFYEWLSASPSGGQKTAIALNEAAAKGVFGQGGEIIRRALDVASGGPLIRTDIDPLIYEAYLRSFPAYEVIRRIPANGIVHTYNQRTAPGTASTINDLGDMSTVATNSTYGQVQSSHIATIVSPRAIGLKLRYAVQQSGMNYNLDGDENLEITGAMSAIAKTSQTLMLQGNSSTAAKTLDDEEGLTDAKGFDGLRPILKGAGTSINKAAGESYVDAINRAVGQIINAGGNVQQLLVLLSVAVRFNVNLELQQFLRVNDRTPAGGVDTALSANGIVTLGEWLTRMLSVPAAAQGEGLGYYNYNAQVTEDVNIIDPMGMAFAYLGSGTPVILELPVGFNNQLSQVYYPFIMHGLVVFISAFHRKVRVPRQTI
jgi:hypothetical protein